ncbi:MAG: CRP-like cAMP-binding protein [Verrucomicrobiales bacterium]|jgi:CRP-like cAMP-binding protein
MTIEGQLESIELFGELTGNERKSVARLMSTATIKPGRDIMVEGTAGREFIIILDGEATVRRGGRILARVGSGDFLGELAVIAGVPRTATVTADTEMNVSVLNRREFSTLLDQQPKLARKVLVGAVKRLYALDPSIVK